jgi:hypothetical protein
MAGLKPGRPLGAPDARLDHPRKHSAPRTLGLQKMASVNRFEGIPDGPAIHYSELSRKVSELTHDVEQFDSLVHSKRRLLQHRTTDGAKAERQFREIRARVDIITTKVHAILDEIALPVADS